MLKERHHGRSQNALEQVLLWIAAAAFAVSVAVASLPSPEQLMGGMGGRIAADRTSVPLQSLPATRHDGGGPVRLRSE
jgi:hypothetical protein